MTIQVRYKIVAVIIFISFGLTLLKLAQTTLFPDDRLKNPSKTTIARGNIYDRKGHLIAGESTTQALFVRPARIPLELREYLKNYFLSTGYYTESEVQNLDKTDRNFVYVKRNLTPTIAKPALDIITLLKDEKYLTNDEIGLLTEGARFYPYDFLQPIVGKLGRDGAGLYGVEYALNTKLNQGYNAYLSIDSEISRIAYEEIFNAVKESQADSGSVGIIDISTREILSLVQVDTNNRATSISHIFEPGSVMKLFSAAFAMEQGIASTTSPTFDDATSYTIGDYTFSQPKFGYINLTTMLTKSANISFARLASQFGSDDYYLWLSELGFGKKPNLPLTSIERGILHPPSSWSALSKPMISIGQEIGVTTLQLLIAASVIGGNGIYTQPLLLTSLKNNQGEEFLEINRTALQLMHPQKSRELIYALENVVKPGGTGAQATIVGVRVAGKTGTGMIADSEGYSKRRNNTVFIGFFPVEQPQYAIVVSVHHPRGDHRSGGLIAAPIFANITRRIILSEHTTK